MANTISCILLHINNQKMTTTQYDTTSKFWRLNSTQFSLLNQTKQKS